MPSLVEIGINVVLHEKIDENVKVLHVMTLAVIGHWRIWLKGGIGAVHPPPPPKIFFKGDVVYLSFF